MEQRFQFISFLGTNNYLFCNYFFEDEKVINVQFVQTAIVKLFCEHFTSNDKITIFITEEAEKRNKSKLLEEFKLHNLPEPEFVKIPSGKSEQQLWELFEIVFESLTPDSEIIFDITHSFRYIPMLSMVLLNYASFVKGVNLAGIYYGALEALGNFKQVEEMPIEKRNVPIFDLTPLALIQKWSVAVENFLESGNVNKISKVVENIRRSHFKGTVKKLSDEQVTSGHYLANSMTEFLADLQTNRGIKLQKAKSANKLLSQINNFDQMASKFPSSLSPLNKINQKVKQMVENFDFDSESIENLIYSVELCLKYDLIQQGFTQLQELIITYVCKKFGFDYLVYEKNRQVIGSLLSVIGSKIPEEKWKHPLTEVSRERLKEIAEDEKVQKLAPLYSNLTKYRNDINHSGFSKDALSTPFDFKNQLKKVFDEVKNIFLEG